MTLYNDTAQWHIAREDQWASAQKSSFKTVPFIRDNVASILVQERPQGLGQSTGITEPITTEESAGGDLELLATRGHLDFILPYIMNHTGVRHQLPLSSKQVSPQGRLVLDFLGNELEKNLSAGDAALITQMAGGRAVSSWGVIRMGDGGGLYIDGLSPGLNFGDHDELVIHYFTPDEQRFSFTMLKAYQGADDHLCLRGGMVTRLSIDLETGALPVMAASILAKDMIVSGAAITATASPRIPPIFNPNDFSVVLTPEVGRALTLKNTIISGFRLVMERLGMSLQFALGSTTPRYISGGDLVVYGALDFMLENHDVFAWMTAHKALSLELRWGDGAAEQVRIFVPKVTFSDGHIIPADDGAPVRAAFQFEASRKDNMPLMRVHLG